MVKIHITTSAAIVFVQTARRMSQLAARLDDPASLALLNDSDRATVAEQIRDASLSAVLASYTHVEAIINELYLDTILFQRQQVFPDISDVLAQRLAGAWNAGADKLNAMEKVKLALVLSDHPFAIDWGAGHAQNFGLLHDLRNTLIHHRPQTIEHGKSPAESDDKIERRLHSKFLAARVWEGKGVAFRWEGCLGGPCAAWAFETATGFVADFFDVLAARYPSEGHI
jgi:hypothetical protein